MWPMSILCRAAALLPGDISPGTGAARHHSFRGHCAHNDRISLV